MSVLAIAPQARTVWNRAANRRCSHTLLLAVVGILAATPCHAYDVLLRWTVPPGLDIAGYRVYSGLASRSYGPPVDVGRLDGATLSGVVYDLHQNLQLGTSDYVAVTAYDSTGAESDYSNERVFNLTSAALPTANAGPDQSVTVGTVVSLGGLADSGIEYFWEQTAGPAATLSSQTTSSTQFTPQTAGTYAFALTAYDVQGVAARDSVTVIVSAPPTLTPSATATRTPTASKTPSQTATRARTSTPTPTRTNTATPTLTVAPPTATRTRTPLPTATSTSRPPTPTFTHASTDPTFTPTPTQTPSGLANDSCANALQIAAVPYAGTVVATTATTDASDPAPGCGNNSRGKSVWYRFIAPSAGTMTAATFGSNYDTILAVFRGSCGAFTLVPAGCNDDSGNLQSRVSFQATAGVTYYFLATAYTNNGGTLKFSLSY